MGEAEHRAQELRVVSPDLEGDEDLLHHGQALLGFGEEGLDDGVALELEVHHPFISIEPDPGRSGPHVEHELAAEVAADVLADHGNAGGGQLLARDLDVARAQRPLVGAEGLEHAGPAEELRGQAAAVRAQLQQAPDEERDRAVAEAGRGRTAGGKQEVIEAAHLGLRVPDAHRDAGAEDGRHLRVLGRTRTGGRGRGRRGRGLAASGTVRRGETMRGRPGVGDGAHQRRATSSATLACRPVQ
jgi:hypothetical protein